MNYFYEWLSESVVDPIWTEAPCGDGVCSAPYEFPAYGRFGCKADCGSATNLISLVIHIQSRFGNSPAVSALELMSQATWNVCLQDPGRYANDLPDLCWYEKDQKLTEVNTNKLIRLDVISGNWYFHLKGDHLGLVAGKIYRLEAEGDLVLTPTVPLWLTCTKTSLFKNAQARMSKFASASPSARSAKTEISSISAEYVSSPRRRMDDLSVLPSLFKTFARETNKNYSGEKSDSQMKVSSSDESALGSEVNVGQTSRRNSKEQKYVTRLTDSNFFDAIETCLNKYEQGLHAADGRCSASEYGSMPEWNTSLVTNMKGAFRDMVTFNADISGWDTSSVTNMSHMFYNAQQFSQDITRWDGSAASSRQQYVFYGANSFLGHFVCPYYFHGAPKLCEIRERVPHIGFRDAINACLLESPVTGNCTEYGMVRTKYGALSDWDVSSVTDMQSVFREKTRFNGEISKWDVRFVRDMSYMFAYTNSFTQNLSIWRTFSLTKMHRILYNSISEPDFSGWDVSNVNDMDGIFENAYSFNSDVGAWDISGVTSMDKMFMNAGKFNESLDLWNTSQVRSMERMFYGADIFNNKISSWDISQVTDLSYIFYEATLFNQAIGDWNVDKVTTFSNTFAYARSFSQDLSKWTGNGADNTHSNAFYGATAFHTKYQCPDTNNGPINLCSCKSDCPTSDVLYATGNSCFSV